MNGIKVGDIINMTITGAKVTHIHGDDIVTVQYPSNLGTWETSAATDSPAITIEHGVPDIRARDLVVDKDGDLWLAVGDPGEIMLVGSVGREPLQDIADQFAPLRVVWREGETDTTPPFDSTYGGQPT